MLYLHMKNKAASYVPDVPVARAYEKALSFYAGISPLTPDAKDFWATQSAYVTFNALFMTVSRVKRPALVKGKYLTLLF